MNLFPAEMIERRIYLLRGCRVMLDEDLAAMYGVLTKVLNQAVKRNARRFPDDFMFQLNEQEAAEVAAFRLQHASMAFLDGGNLKSQIVTSSSGHGGRRTAPFAFTEQGVAMLSGILNSDRAIDVNIAIMRAFVRLRLMIASNKELAQKLAEMDKKYDSQFKVVFDAIRQIMSPPEQKKRKIGFGNDVD
ncbi:MAG: ORF6N domain-containing protein [Nitrospirae bacterium]|nr:ORF6N domain-containing protein [Nitrospirota bacterium]